MKNHEQWWKQAVFYRIVPSAFTEKGLSGIMDKAEYLRGLGVDGVWLCTEGESVNPAELEKLEQALSAHGLELVAGPDWMGRPVARVRVEEQTLTFSYAIHDRCRRANWEAVPYDAFEMKKLLLEDVQKEELTVRFFEGPDLPRSVSEMGQEGEYREESAALLGAVLLTLPGPVMLYQGEELGMVNRLFTLEELERSEAALWLKTADAQKRTRAELEAKISRLTRLNALEKLDWTKAEENSVLKWYQTLLNLRKNSPALSCGDFTPMLEDHRRVLAFRRTFGEETVLVFANLTAYAAEYAPELEEGTVVCSNYADRWKGILRPFEFRILRIYS